MSLHVNAFFNEVGNGEVELDVQKVKNVLKGYPELYSFSEALQLINDDFDENVAAFCAIFLMLGYRRGRKVEEENEVLKVPEVVETVPETEEQTISSEDLEKFTKIIELIAAAVKEFEQE